MDARECERIYIMQTLNMYRVDIYTDTEENDVKNNEIDSMTFTIPSTSKENARFAAEDIVGMLQENHYTREVRYSIGVTWLRRIS